MVAFWRVALSFVALISLVDVVSDILVRLTERCCFVALAVESDPACCL